jgi:hypothetical protein
MVPSTSSATASGKHEARRIADAGDEACPLLFNQPMTSVAGLLRYASPLVLLAVSACASLRGSSNGNSETVCTSGGRRCSSYEVRETPQGRFFRESSDSQQRDQAYRNGNSYIPEHAPGESSGHFLSRMQQESDRHDAYQKGKSWSGPTESNSWTPTTPSLSTGSSYR